MKEIWKPLDGIVLEKAAYEAVISEKNTLVYAGPGSGKTELLAQKAAYIIQNNKLNHNRKILAISFKKDSAKNLIERVSKRVGDASDSFDSITFDAFAKRILDQFRLSLSKDFCPSIDYMIEKNINDYAIEIYETLNNKLEKYEKDSLRNDLERKEISETDEKTIKIWKELLKLKPSRVSFPMITNLVLKLLGENPYILRAIQATYQYVFLDEFQDTTTLQYRFVQYLFSKNEKTVVTAVGDTNQRIMIWAGADEKAFDKFVSDFKAEAKTLVFNHRSSSKLIKLQTEIYKIMNEKPININYGKESEKGEDSKIFLFEFENEEHEANTICKFIEKEISKKVLPNEIAILTKQLPRDYTYLIIDKLKDKEIFCRIEDEYQDLIKEELTRLIIATLRLIYNMVSHESWIIINNYFSQFIVESDSYYVIIDQGIRVIKKDYPIINDLNCDEVIDAILMFLGIEKLKGIFTHYAQGNYLADIVNKFKSLFKKALETQKDLSVNEAIDDFMGLHSIPIMTIHKSKGLEYKSIVFVGLEDSAFWSFRDQPEENKCAFFVALSRAKQNLFFTFSKKRAKSRFPSQVQKKNAINEIYEILMTSSDVEYYLMDASEV